MAAASESEAAIRAVTTATPSAPVPRKISKFSLFNPPIATTGIDTAFRISASVSGFVSTVFTFVVVGYIAPTPR